VIEYKGFTQLDPDTDETMSVPIYRVMFNGDDADYILSDSCPEVDVPTVLMTGVIRNLQVFGIEEARFRAIDQMNAACEASDALRGTNQCHLQTITGQLCYRGALSFIPRGGVAINPDIDPLEKACFETAGDFIRTHIKKPSPQQIRSTVPCLIYGTVQRIGTGISRIKVPRDTMFPSQTADEVMDKYEVINGKTKPNAAGKKNPLDELKVTPLDKI